MPNGPVPCIAALMLLAVAAPAAAQYVDPDTCSMADFSCQQARKERSDKADQQASDDAARQAQRQKLLRLPPVPDERNVLLGSWRLEDGNKGRAGAGPGQGRGAAGADAMFRELWTTLQTNPEKLFCSEMLFGHGITFQPSTYSIKALDGSVSRSSIAYRSTQKQVIVAIPGNMKMNLVFEVAGPDRILFGGSCALVRVGAVAAPTAGAPPQVTAVAPAPQRSTLSRPSPEVCRNTLLDKLGVVGSNQVRAMSDVRFREAAIEGKVPNTNNLRIDLRGSACDDPRIKATLYDFDAHEMLQAITFVWERPPGPAPAPIFAERVTALSRFHPSLPPPQTTGRLQGDTSLGRLILQDMPERNLLLEAYAARK